MNPSELASMSAKYPIIDETLPYDEAVSRVRQTRKAQIFLRVGTRVAFVKGAIHETNTPGVALEVTKEQALKFLDDAIPQHWRSNLCVRVGVSKRCMFIGSSPR